MVPGSGDEKPNMPAAVPAQGAIPDTSRFAAPLLWMSNVFLTYVPASTPVPKESVVGESAAPGAPVGAGSAAPVTPSWIDGFAGSFVASCRHEVELAATVGW